MSGGAIEHNMDPEVMHNIREYFEHLSQGAYGSGDDTWWPQMPKINSFLVCSPRQSDRKPGQMITTADTNYKELLKHLTTIAKHYKTRKTLVKHKVCMCQYVLENIKIHGLSNGGFANTIKQTNTKAINNIKMANWNSTIAKAEWIVKNMEKATFLMAIIEEKDFDDYNDALNTLGAVIDPGYDQKMKELTALLLKDVGANADKIDLKDVYSFESRPTFLGKNAKVFDRKQASDRSQAQKNLIEYMVVKTAKLPTKTDDDFLKEMIAYLEMFDPWTCTKIKQDQILFQPFLEMKLSEFHTYANLYNTGHCYTLEYFGRQILMNYGSLNLDGINLQDPDHKDVKEVFINQIIPQIGRYYADLDDRDYSKLELQQKLTKTIRLDVLKKALMELSGNAAKQLVTIENSDSMWGAVKKDQEKLTMIFRALFDGYGNALKKDQFLDIHRLLGDGLFHLIGLLGYTFVADNIIQKDDETNSDLFHISMACVQEWVEFRKALNDILLRGDSAQDSAEQKTIAQMLNENLIIEVNGMHINFDGLTQDIVGSCIHGAGNRMCSRYLYLHDQCKIAELDVKLAPMFWEVPIGLKGSGGPLEGIDYMTCIRTDEFNHNDNNYNPLNCDYYVVGYKCNPVTSTYRSEYVCRVVMEDYNGNFTNKQSGFEDASDYHNAKQIFRVLPYIHDSGMKPTDNATRAAAFFTIRKNMKSLVELMRIPYLFGKERKLTFHLYKEFVLHSYRLIHDLKPNAGNSQLQRKYARWKNAIKTAEPYNVMEAEQISLKNLEPRKLVNTFLAYKIGSGDKRMKYILNADYNTGNSEDDKETFDVLSNYWDIEQDSEGIVKDPATTRDVTRMYHYLTILRKMLSPDGVFKNVIPMTPHTTTEEYQKLFVLLERYYRSLNQNFTLTSVIFKELETVAIFEEDNTFVNLSKDVLNGYIQELTMKKMTGQMKEDLQLKMYEFLKVFHTATAYDARKLFKSIRDLFGESKSTMSVDYEIKGKKVTFVLNVMQEILEEIRVYMSLVAGVALTMFHKKHDVVVVKNSIYDIVKMYNYLDEYDDDEKFLHSFWEVMYDLTFSWLCGYGQTPSNFQFHFTEVMRDALFYHNTMWKRVNETKNVTPCTKICERLGLSEKPTMCHEVSAVFAFLNEHLWYYKEGQLPIGDVPKDLKNTFESYKNMKLRDEDYQDSLQVVFEHWIKMNLVEAHNTRFQQIMLYQEFLTKYIWGEPYMNLDGNSGEENMDMMSASGRAYRMNNIIKEILIKIFYASHDEQLQWQLLSSLDSKLSNYAMFDEYLGMNDIVGQGGDRRKKSGRGTRVSKKPASEKRDKKLKKPAKELKKP